MYINSFNPQNDPAGGDCGYSCFTLEEIKPQRGQDPCLRPLSRAGAGTGIEITFARLFPPGTTSQRATRRLV